jgi:hypothetical protein
MRRLLFVPLVVAVAVAVAVAAPLDAVRAGYGEVTHINFILMQAMPQDVVDKANTAARLEVPARYGKDVDLDAPAMKAFYAELSSRHTVIDPTLTVPK